MNILITGGKGYLGKRICAHLSKVKNHTIIVTSRNSAAIPELRNVIVKKVNTAKDNLEEVLLNIDVLIHLAALDAPSCVNYPLDAIEVNIKDTVKWLEAATAVGVKQFLYFSTIHVYGNGLKGIIDENIITNPTHPYAITHKTSEDYVLSYQSKANFKSYVFRLSNSVGYPIGDMLQWNLLVPDLCKSAVEAKTITLKSNPLIRRDFLPIEDVVNAVTYFIEHDDIVSQGVFNLSSNKSKTIKEIATLVQVKTQEVLNFTPKINILSPEVTGLSAFSIDNSKIIKQGFKFKNNLEQEIVDLLKYCKNNNL